MGKSRKIALKIILLNIISHTQGIKFWLRPEIVCKISNESVCTILGNTIAQPDNIIAAWLSIEVDIIT